MALKLEPTISKAMDARLVIDGQQRLTTLQLLVAAARDVCRKLEAKDYADDFNFLVEDTELESFSAGTFRR